jgi:NADPH2:quinone reductase
MRAVVVAEHGGSDVLERRDVDPPEAGPGQVLVDVAAAGVNYIDTYQRTGRYPIETPFTLGLEGAGTVVAVGQDVADVSVGDHVAWKNALGSYAEQITVPSDEAVPVPDGVSDEVAAALILQGLTAHYLATSTYAVQPGDWVVVHAAAGGVGRLLTQVVKLRGGHVIATTSTGPKAELAKQAGADIVTTYDDFAVAARELTGGDGVPCVYDGVGRATFDSDLDALRPRGLLAMFGAASGPVPPVDVQVLNAKGSLYLTRPTLAHYTRDRAELTGRTDELFAWVKDARLDVRIGGRYALDDARKAHDDLEGRRTTGKLLLIP